MRRATGGKRRDIAEKPIVEALRAVGAQVEYCLGERAPDILVRFRSQWWPFEVKSGRGKQTNSQKQTNYPIVRTVEDALRQIGATAHPDQTLRER